MNNEFLHSQSLLPYQRWDVSGYASKGARFFPSNFSTNDARHWANILRVTQGTWPSELLHMLLEKPFWNWRKNLNESKLSEVG